MALSATKPTPKDTQCVRQLAQQVAQIAASAENQQRIKRWRDVNALRKPDRAPVWCKPVGAWNEIIPAESLCCQDEWLRAIELDFRKTIKKNEIGDDEPVESFFGVPAVFDVDPPNTWGVDVGSHRPTQAGGSWAFDPPIKTAADLDKLRMPSLIYNEPKSREHLSRAQDLLGDIMPARLVCYTPKSVATLGIALADLRGLEQMMMDMATEPELIHKLTAFVRDAALKNLAEIEATGLLTPNNVGPMTCSDPIGPQDCPPSLKNCWLMANSQEYDQVSPAMWEEFCLNYQKPIFEKFGLVGYGCCENLTKKIDGVLAIPNLRIFTCSAWTNLDLVIEKVGAKHVIMWRQKASDVVFPDDNATIKRDLEEGARKLQGCHYQIVLRELQTLSGHPDRLHVWTQMAIEAAQKYA